MVCLQDTECDAWWFPGTSDPEKPCYGYWTAQDDQRTPVQFFGLSSVGPTILKYSGYKPGPFGEKFRFSVLINTKPLSFFLFLTSTFSSYFILLLDICPCVECIDDRSFEEFVYVLLPPYPQTFP